MNWIKWFYPGVKIKRWLFLILIGILCAFLGLTVISLGIISFFVVDSERFLSIVTDKVNVSLIALLGVTALLVGFFCAVLGLKGLFKSLRTTFKVEKGSSIIDFIYKQRLLVKGASVVVIGGGTGLSILLRGIKQVTGNCTAIVAATDDGGSSGKLREELGLIPPGDLRNCITAMADTEPLMEKVMQYRFDKGSLAGHSLGNLFIAAMADISDDMEKGLNNTSKILKVRGSVVPSTLEKVVLKAEMSDKTIVKGETKISSAGKRIKKLMLEPSTPAATKSAVSAILDADILVFGPGSLYTSVITNLIIPGIREAIIASKGVKVYICNVMTQPGETTDYTAYDHIKALYDHVGENFLDFVIVNKQKVPDFLLDKYAEEGSYLVSYDKEKLYRLGIEVIEENLISEENLVRHEPIKLAKAVISLMHTLRLDRKRMNFLDSYFAKKSLKSK